jgi:hypothetical protein
MTRSKELTEEIKQDLSNNIFLSGDSSRSKVLGLGNVVVSNDTFIDNIMLVESLSYNLISIRQLALHGFRTYFGVRLVTLI